MNSPLQPEINNSLYSINRYEKEFIEINGQRWSQSCIISTENKPIPWEPKSIDEVNESNLNIIRSLRPEIIILGTGEKHSFLPQGLVIFPIDEDDEISRFLETNENKKTSIQIECMNTAAACRTFNILSQEERKVVAAILI